MSVDRTNPWAEQAEENYYVSITDMMIGLIFFFLILLMYFATQLRDTTEEITNSEAARDELIGQVAEYARANGVSVTVDRSTGVMRFPNDVLFARSSNRLTPGSGRALSVLADALAYYVPCYSFGAAQAARAHCKQTAHHLDAILIEGHTDSTVLSSPLKGLRGTESDVEISDNWGLSASRASTVFQTLIAERPDLAELYNAPIERHHARRLFGVAGYADQRPIIPGNNELQQAANRRVEVRFVMALPTKHDLAETTPPVDRTTNPPPAPVGVDQKIEFAADNPTDAYLRNGWSWREDWGVWSVGHDSILVLPIRDGDPFRSYELVLEIVAYVPNLSPLREVDVMLNGYHAAHWRFQGPKNFYIETVKVPSGAVRPGETLRLQFSVANPVSPRRLTNPNDNRAIGIGLVSVEIQPAA